MGSTLNSKDSKYYDCSKERRSLWTALVKKVFMKDLDLQGWKSFRLGEGRENCVLERRTDVVRRLEGEINVTSVRASQEIDLVRVVKAEEEFCQAFKVKVELDSGGDQVCTRYPSCLWTYVYHLLLITFSVVGCFNALGI